MDCPKRVEANKIDVIIPEGFRSLQKGEIIPEMAYCATTINCDGEIIWKRSASVGKFVKDSELFHICPIANIYIEKEHVNRKDEK